MKERKILTKEVPIRHKSHILRNIMLMSVSVGLATLFSKATDPKRDFYLKKLG